MSQNNVIWTAHARIKMRQYGLSESRVKRILRWPRRLEKGIAPKAADAGAVGADVAHIGHTGCGQSNNLDLHVGYQGLVAKALIFQVWRAFCLIRIALHLIQIAVCTAALHR